MRLNFVNVKKNVMHNDITVMNSTSSSFTNPSNDCYKGETIKDQGSRAI